MDLQCTFKPKDVHFKKTTLLQLFFCQERSAGNIGRKKNIVTNYLKTNQMQNKQQQQQKHPPTETAEKQYGLTKP